MPHVLSKLCQHNLPVVFRWQATVAHISEHRSKLARPARDLTDVHVRHIFLDTPAAPALEIHMPDRKRSDRKRATLREHGTLNPRPERVTDQLFGQSEFFDARDLVQVKYEMIRRVQIDEASVAAASSGFGFSRPSFYQAQQAFTRGGLAGLLPRKRGPQGAHKLGPEVMSFIGEVQAGDPSVTASALVPLLKKRFCIEVHPRSIERALSRQEKKRR